MRPLPCCWCSFQGSNRNKHWDLPSPTRLWHQQLSQRSSSLPNRMSLCIVLHKKHAFARASRDFRGWQTTGAEFRGFLFLFFIFMAVQAGKTPKAKKFISCKRLSVVGLVSTFSCEQPRHFVCLFASCFLFVLLLVFFTELKGASCLLSAAGFIYSSCLFLSLFLRN